MKLWRAVKLLLTLHCDESARLLSDSTLRPLSRVEWWAVRLHQVSCRVCRQLERQLQAVDQAAETHGSQPVQMSAAAKDRIAAKLAASVENNRE